MVRAQNPQYFPSFVGEKFFPDQRDALQEHTYLRKSISDGNRHEQKRKLFLTLQCGFCCKVTLVATK
jgi:hypothetical protein